MKSYLEITAKKYKAACSPIATTLVSVVKAAWFDLGIRCVAPLFRLDIQHLSPQLGLAAQGSQDTVFDTKSRTSNSVPSGPGTDSMLTPSAYPRRCASSATLPLELSNEAFAFQSELFIQFMASVSNKKTIVPCPVNSLRGLLSRETSVVVSRDHLKGARNTKPDASFRIIYRQSFWCHQHGFWPSTNLPFDVHIQPPFCPSAQRLHSRFDTQATVEFGAAAIALQASCVRS